VKKNGIKLQFCLGPLSNGVILVQVLHLSLSFTLLTLLIIPVSGVCERQRERDTQRERERERENDGCSLMHTHHKLCAFLLGTEENCGESRGILGTGPLVK
jgi:hypothetical protein